MYKYIINDWCYKFGRQETWGNRKRIIPNMTMFIESVGDIKVVFTF